MTQLRGNSGRYAGMLLRNQEPIVEDKQSKNEIESLRKLRLSEEWSCHTCKYMIRVAHGRIGCSENINDPPRANSWERRCVGWIRNNNLKQTT